MLASSSSTRNGRTPGQPRPAPAVPVIGAGAQLPEPAAHDPQMLPTTSALSCTAVAPSFMLGDSSADARAIVLHSSCAGGLPWYYRALGPGHMIVYRSWKAPMAPSGPRTCCARACHDDTPSGPQDLGHRPLSQRSFLWPKRLTAGGAGAKEASSGAVGPGEALGTLVTISGYVKRPRYARLNTPMGADGAISCMSCSPYL